VILITNWKEADFPPNKTLLKCVALLEGVQQQAGHQQTEVQQQTKHKTCVMSW